MSLPKPENPSALPYGIDVTQPKDKPHIKKDGHVWRAYYHFRAGFGITPVEAFKNLQARYNA